MKSFLTQKIIKPYSKRNSDADAKREVYAATTVNKDEGDEGRELTEQVITKQQIASYHKKFFELVSKCRLDGRSSSVHRTG